jgi:hypothetical protein
MRKQGAVDSVSGLMPLVGGDSGAVQRQVGHVKRAMIRGVYAVYA